MVKETTFPTLSREAAFELLSKKYPERFADDALIRLDVTDRMVYYTWPQEFSNTSGPFHTIGGNAMTTFQIEAWEVDAFVVLFTRGRAFLVRDGYVQTALADRHGKQFSIR
jgi:hypothetical protein